MMLRRNKKRDEPATSPQQVQEGSTQGSDSRFMHASGPSRTGHGGMMSSSSTMSALFSMGSSSNGAGTSAPLSRTSPHPLYMQGQGKNSSSSSITRGSARVFDARRQHQQMQQYQQPLTAPPSIQESHTTTAQHQHLSQKYGAPPARHRQLPTSPSVEAFGTPSSSAQQMPPVSPSLSQHSAAQVPGTMPVAQMGRSQSTLNFLLSKAKSPFSSSSSSSQQASNSSQHALTSSSISTSASNASFQVPVDEAAWKDSYHTGRNRTASASSTSVHHSGIPIEHGEASSQGLGRSLGDDSSGVGSPSPVKRSLFGRDRKASTNSNLSRSMERNGASGPARSALSSYNPILRRGGRQDSAGSNYSFSKSQSDLHARPDFPSPSSGPMDLPRVAEDFEQSHQASKDARNYGQPTAASGSSVSSIDTGMLRSPLTPNAAFTRSVDDLSRSHTPEPHHQYGGVRSKTPVGDAGVVPSDIGRVGEAAAYLAPARRTARPHNGPASQNAPSASANVRSTAHLSPPRSGKDSELMGTNMSLSAAAVSASKAAASVVAAGDTSRRLPPGITYQGFLNRNVNISASIAQLNESNTGRGGREKDISKGWKPYKAVLRDGKLFFYKPPGTIADDIKNLFPASVVIDAASSAPFAEQGLSVDDLRRNKLNTLDLLHATSSDGCARPPTKRTPSSQSVALSQEMDTDESREWHRPGKHRDLALAISHDEPSSWLARIRGGSLEALSHEYAYATQAGGTPSLDEARAFYFALLHTHVFRAKRPLQSLLVALHKWAVHASHQPSEGTEQVNSHLESESERHLSEKSLSARMALVADAGLIALVDDETKPSILILIQDIARDCTKNLVQESDIGSPTRIESTHLQRASYDQALAQFSTSYLLSCDPSSVAKQIHAFHVEKCSLLLSGTNSIITLMKETAEEVEPTLAIFDWKRPHFLTRLVWDHILGPGQMQNLVVNGPVQAAKERASLLRHWIAVASYLLKMKDVAAWLAISTALCSRAIARLSMTWRFVATSDRALVSTCWAPALAKVGWSEIESPHVLAFADEAATVKSSINASVSATSAHDTLPYLGNALLSLHRLGPLASNSAGFFPLAQSQAAANNLVKLHTHLTTLNGMTNYRPVQHVDESVHRAFGAMLSAYCSSDSNSTTYLTLSMQIEAPLLGRASRSATSQFTRHIAAAAISPLVFEDPLPNLALVNVEDVIDTLTAAENMASAKSTSIGMSSTESEDASNTLRRSRQNASSTPLARAKSLSATIPPRLVRNMPFGDIFECAPGTPSHGTAQGDNLLRISPDLIFAVSSDQPLSAPSSPMMGKRFSQSVSGGNSRPNSHASKRSSLPSSERSSLIEPVAAPLQVSVKAASLERLLDVLVMGASHLTTEMSNDEAVERIGSFGPRRQRLSLDLTHHRKIFLATYRTICSPVALFEHLQKRLFAAYDAGREMALPAVHRPNFPAWPVTEQAGFSTTQIDWDVVSKIRQGVYSILSLWISRHSFDFLENDDLYSGVHSLAGLLEASRTRDIDDMDFDKTLRALDDLTKQLRLAVMASQSERRVSKRSSKRASATGTTALNLAQGGSPTINFDSASATEVVDYLESVVRVFFDKIDDVDLLQVYELFNEHANDSAAWHVARYSEAASQPQVEDIPAANGMYKLLELLRWPPESKPLVQKLPPPIRDACAAQNLLRGWTAIQIIQENIGLERRKARICKLIDALWICRARMCTSRTDDAGTSILNPGLVFQEPTIASFVESVIAGSLTSSESRLFSHAWQAAASERGSTAETLMGLAPNREACDSLRDAIQSSSTPDVGWLLKSIALTVSRVPEFNLGRSILLDFDKYRIIFSLIESSVGRIKGGALDPVLVDLAGSRLSAMQQALRSIVWDRRTFKENNAREAPPANAVQLEGKSSSRRPTKPLTGITSLQQEKLRRDRVAFEQISAYSQREHERTLAAKQEAEHMPLDPLPPLVSPPLRPTTISANEKKTRRMTALFRGAVRPMGLMSSSSNPDRGMADTAIHTPDELMSMTSTSKAAHITQCGSSRVSSWTNSQRSFVFNLSPPEGGHVLLQAANRRELNEWVYAIEKTSKEFARGQLQSTAVDPSRKGANGALAKASKSTGLPLYGTDIETLAEQFKCSVPPGLERMLQQVEARGLREQGIYRISGAKSAIDALKIAFDTMPADSVNLSTGEFSDVHTIAGAIKQWFRDLPDPVIPHSAYKAFIAAECMDNEEDRLYAIRDLIWDFSRVHFELLKRVCEHLSLVCNETAHNLMAPHNIGLVFGTSLLSPPPSPASVAESFGNIGKAAHIVKILLTMHEWLFEAEQESERNVATADEPIMHGESDVHLVHPATGEADEAPFEMESTTRDSAFSDHRPIVEAPTAIAGFLMPDPPSKTSSDSGMLRAVMTAQDQSTSDHVDETLVQDNEKSDAFKKRERRRESINHASGLSPISAMPTDMPRSAAAPPVIADVLEEQSDDEDDAVEHMALAPAGEGVRDTLGPIPRTKATTGNRRSRTESVYLDAREAIAALQNPFDEEDDAGGSDEPVEGSKEEDAGVSSKREIGQSATSLPIQIPLASVAERTVPEIRHDAAV